MANLLATLRLSLVYPAPGGQSVTVPQIQVNVPFQGSSVGFIDVPDETAAEAEIAVPFGTVDEGAGLVFLQNDTGQELDLKINGEASDMALAPGAVWCSASAALPAGTPLTELAVVTTAEQSGSGRIGYWVFGDPETP